MFFDESRIISLIGLKYSEDEGTRAWEKRKECYITDMQLPKSFQEVLTGKFEDVCSFLFALHPENINREIVSIINSAHIFVEKKVIKQQIQSALYKRFFHPDALILEKQSGKKTHVFGEEPDMELGFFEKLIEMYKYRKILSDLKQELEEKDDLSIGYTHVEEKFIVDQMLSYNCKYVRTIMTPRAKEIDEKIQRIANKTRFENFVACYNALKCQCEQEYDLFVNVSLWKDILEPLCDRTHSQYGIVAIIRASMVFVNKEIAK